MTIMKGKGHSMRLFTHTGSGLDLRDHVDETSTVADLVSQSGVDDAAVWLEDADEPLGPSTRLGDALHDGAHIHICACRRIAVTVHYGGQTIERSFPPSATIQRLRRWALGSRGFDLPKSQRPVHELGVAGTGVIAERDDHAGTLATDCALQLDLAPKDRFQG